MDQIKKMIMDEKKNSDMQLDHMELNRRGNEVIVNFIYSDYQAGGDVHTAPRAKDPIMMNMESAEQLKTFLKDEGISFTERQDEFM